MVRIAILHSYVLGRFAVFVAPERVLDRRRELPNDRWGFL